MLRLRRVRARAVLVLICFEGLLAGAVSIRVD